MPSGFRKYNAKAATVCKPVKKHKTKKEKAVKLIQQTVQYPGSTDRMIQEAVETFPEKTFEKPDEPYKNVLAFSETGKISLIIF